MGYDWTFSDGTYTRTVKVDQLNQEVSIGAVSVEVYARDPAAITFAILKKTDWVALDPTAPADEVTTTRYNAVSSMVDSSGGSTDPRVIISGKTNVSWTLINSAFFTIGEEYVILPISTNIIYQTLGRDNRWNNTSNMVKWKYMQTRGRYCLIFTSEDVSEYYFFAT